MRILKPYSESIMGVFDFGGLSAEDLTALIEDEGLDIEDLSIEVEEGTVSIYGTAADERTHKKAIKILESAEGVESVDDQLEIYEGDEEEEEEYEEEEEEEDGGSRKKKVDSNVYVVKYGDTLWGIAEKFYGDGSKYMKIFEANRHLWKAYNNDPNVLYPNWELTIP
ncbi:MAG: LysM peptidoglycan-binding domain-containing protein [Bacteroidetes bacterium]|nr:MAG: LysM peptidoglycan-binding domain-containing protein [Bacteroidota bacterium]